MSETSRHSTVFKQSSISIVKITKHNNLIPITPIKRAHQTHLSSPNKREKNNEIVTNKPPIPSNFLNQAFISSPASPLTPKSIRSFSNINLNSPNSFNELDVPTINFNPSTARIIKIFNNHSPSPLSIVSPVSTNSQFSKINSPLINNNAKVIFTVPPVNKQQSTTISSSVEINSNQNHMQSINNNENTKQHKCSACGEFGHLRSTNKLCKFFKKRQPKTTKLTHNPNSSTNQIVDNNQPIVNELIENQINLSMLRDYNLNNDITPNTNRRLSYESLSKAQYLKEFNSKLNGPLHAQPWTNEIKANYYKRINKLKSVYCNNCHELWPSLSNDCKNCKKNPIKFSARNNMIPDFDNIPLDIKKSFEELTPVEEMLISPALPVMCMFRLPNGQLISRGFVANFSQDINSITTVLPRLNVPILIVRRKGTNNVHKDFFVNRERIMKCLSFLCKYNQSWINMGIKIEQQNIESLPENGILNTLHEIESENENDFISDEGPESLEEYLANTEEVEDYQAYMEVNPNKIFKIDQIKQAINWNPINETPIDEFNCDGLASMCFPKLFILGNADPTKKSRLQEVTETEAYQHLIKYSTKSAKTGLFYYPYVTHTRFLQWAYDRRTRHQALSQAKIFFKQCPADANLTISELKQMIRSNDGIEASNLMKRMSAYSANITGSDAFWFKNRQVLHAIFEQKLPPTLFFTFSYADNHWLDLHRLMPSCYDNNSIDQQFTLSQKIKNSLNNPHLVDWYFSWRLNEFLKSFIDECLEANWRYHRYEWQARTAIHAHGCARLNNDPGLIDLTTKVYLGRLAIKKLELTTLDQNTKLQLLQQVQEASLAETKIIDYVDTLVTAWNESDFENTVPIRDPHPCGTNIEKFDSQQLDSHYKNLINCVQRHTCRVNSYCKSSKKALEGKCRFGYPFEKQQQTKIDFIETNNTVKAEITYKRNDEFMNVHNRLFSSIWQANTDAKPILDYAACCDYMLKYITKGEKASQSLLKLFHDVISTSTEDQDPRSKLRSLMIRSVAGKRDLGAGEVSRYLLSEPTYHSEFDAVFLNLDLNVKELNIENFQSNENEHDSEKSIYKNSIIDFYANRLKNPFLSEYINSILHLIHFVQLFKINNKSNKLEKRHNPDKIVVIPYPKVNQNKQNKKQYAEYCKFQLIKYSPWTVDQLEQIKSTDNSIEKWEDFLKTSPENVLNSLSFDNNLSAKLIELRNNPDPDIDTEEELTRQSWMYASEMQPQNFNQDDESRPYVDLKYDWLTHRNKYTLLELESMHNWIQIQKQMYNHNDNNQSIQIVLPEQLNIEQRLAYNIVKHHLDKNLQLLLLIIGTAGTGKSFTINAISRLLGRKLKRAAPTGKAAFLICGETCHQLFSLSVDKFETNKYIPLTNDRLAELESKLREIEYIIIDEYSMLSQVSLAIIDFRLRQAKKIDTYFGGISIILTGDPGQLLPVLGSPLYRTIDNKSGFMSVHGFNTYRTFKLAVKLQVVVRQQSNNDPNQMKFIDLLPRVRNGLVTEADWRFLLTREANAINMRQTKFKNAIHLFCDRDSVNIHNKLKLMELNMPIVPLLAKNSNSRCKNADDDYFGGLPNEIYLSINSQVLLTTNEWTETGLVNGATGIIHDIIYPNKQQLSLLDTLPDIVLVDFDQYSGPSFFHDDDRKKVIPIYTRQMRSKYHDGHRTQMPIRLNYATTIHKSQGSTLSSGIIDLGKRETSLGLTFVALSRFKNINDFLIKPFPFQRIDNIKNHKSLKVRLEEEIRIDYLVEETKKIFSDYHFI